MSELKRYEEAIRHYTAAEVIAGATAPRYLTHLFYFQSGVAFERAKRFDDASIQFEKSIELKPDFADALNYLGYMWAEQGKNLPRALELIRKAVDLEPKNAAYLDSLAWVLFQMDRAEEALPFQTRAVELSEEPDATLFEHLGDIYRKLGRMDDARRAWQRSLAVESKPEVAERLKEAGGPLSDDSPTAR
ncbi:MAG: tetratricopeptide repeat protein [Verrucomicrobiales bacterium]|nr:tetratricopeptide repeat protein [Verrucomicrobiales bacterium]